MIAKALGVPRYLLWYPLTILIRSYFLNQKCSCPDCESESVLKDGFNRRKTMPNTRMLECKECGKDFCVRAKTIFYWKHASIGELFINSGFFFGVGSREWTSRWICDVGKYCSLEEKAFVKHAGGASNFLSGFFQADEMQIRSFGEKPLILGVKRWDDKVFETPLLGDSVLEFKSGLKEADRELGPLVRLATDGHSSYPQAAEWLGIVHHQANRSETGFVDQLGFHSNGVENLRSQARDWAEAARGYGSMETLKRAVKARQVYHNRVRESPLPVRSFLKLVPSNR